MPPNPIDELRKELDSVRGDLRKVQGELQNAKNEIDNTWKPAVAALETQVGNLKQKGKDLDDLIIQFGAHTLQELKNKFNALIGGSTAPGGDTSSPLPGGDPMEPLARLAEAINKAESTLNGQNLVIAEGSVDVTLQMKVGDGISADTSIHLSIHPRSFQ